MPNLGDELASLDFSNLIGGPLNAIVEAQGKSAITTVDFIKQVGFDSQTNKVINVDFSYDKNVTDPNTGNESREDFTLTVPFLTMVPIPYISVNKAQIEFNAKLTSSTHSKTTSSLSANASFSGSASYWFFKAKMSASTAYKKSTESGSQVDRSYSMRILVEAANAELPAGTERILTILENVISENQTSGSTTTTTTT